MGHAEPERKMSWHEAEEYTCAGPMPIVVTPNRTTSLALHNPTVKELMLMVLGMLKKGKSV